jgi:hypothetical protein
MTTGGRLLLRDKGRTAHRPQQQRTVQITGAMIDALDRHLGWNDKPRS